MDFSFFCNVLVSLTAWFSVFLLLKRKIRNHYIGFLFITGAASLFAAYGHSDLIRTGGYPILLLCSRVASIIALLYFAKGTLYTFGLYIFKPVKSLNTLIPGFLLTSLLIKNSFGPVMIYGVLSMAFLGSWAFIRHYPVAPGFSLLMLIGIFISILAAVVFGFIPENSGIKPADISHILMAVALVFIASSLYKIREYDIAQ